MIKLLTYAWSFDTGRIPPGYFLWMAFRVLRHLSDNLANHVDGWRDIKTRLGVAAVNYLLDTRDAKFFIKFSDPFNKDIYNELYRRDETSSCLIYGIHWGFRKRENNIFFAWFSSWWGPCQGHLIPGELPTPVDQRVRLINICCSNQKKP